MVGRGWIWEKYQTCWIFIPTSTDQNRLKQTLNFVETDPQKALIGSLSRVVEQGH